jgi:RNA polymerase sigma factor (sigma-70 family)
MQMPQPPMPLTSQVIFRLAARHGDRSTDHELLQRFIAGREEAAFAALVERHGGMVLRVCRSILRSHHEAEDVFQAVFLVLARKAGSIRKGESVGSWLHAIATRLAQKARARAGKRRTCEQQAAPGSQRTPMDDVTWGELRGILHEEVSRLPEKCRAAVVLCYWEGQTYEQAARQLGCARDTVKDRLEKARALLRTRLARRGLALPAAWLAASLSESTAAAPAALVEATVRGAMLFSIGRSPAGAVSAAAAAWAGEVCQGVLMSRLQLTLALLLMLGVLGGGAGLAVLREPAEAERPNVERAEAGRPAEPLPAGVVERLGTLRFRHGDHVRCIALGGDGDSVVSAAGKVVHVWELATGKERRRFEGHDSEVFAVACSRGKRIAALCTDGTIHLWDAGTGQKMRSYFAHTPSRHEVWRRWQLPGYPGLAFSPDGKQLVSRGSDNTIRLWDTATGAKKREFNTFSLRELTRSSARAFTLSPDGKLLAAFEGNLDAPHLQLWDVATGRLLKEPAPKDSLWGAAFSPDGKTLALCVGKAPFGGTAVLELWALAGAKKIGSFALSEGGMLLGFSPDGKTLAFRGPDMPHFRDVQTGKVVGRLRSKRPTTINQLLFSRDGKTLVTFSHLEHSLRLWDRASGKELRSSDDAVSSVRCAFSPDGRLLACGSEDGAVRIWDRAVGKVVRRIDQDPLLTEMLFSPDGRRLATARTAVHLWDVASGKEIRQIKTPGDAIKRMAWSGDGRWLATWWAGDPFIPLWDAATGKEVRRLSCRDAGINSLVFSPDGKMLVAACNGLDRGELLAWAVGAAGRRVSFEGPVPAGLKCLAFTPDGRTLAAGAMDRSVYLWEVVSGRRRATLKMEEIPTSLAYSPDGKVLAAASNSNYRDTGLIDDGVYPEAGKSLPPRIRLWDVAAEKELPPLQGHHGSVTSLSFSPDGKLLATGSNDTTVLLWDATRWRVRPPTEARLRPEQVEALWADLGADAVKAYRAIRTLAAAPASSMEYFKQHLRPVKPADPGRVARLLADLDSGQFETREKAVQELEKLGPSAATELRKALAGEPTLEVKRRIERLLEKESGGDHVREVRALEALERMGTAQAREMCARLAEGVPDAPLTREARATLRRFLK